MKSDLIQAIHKQTSNYVEERYIFFYVTIKHNPIAYNYIVIRTKF